MRPSHPHPGYGGGGPAPPPYGGGGRAALPHHRLGGHHHNFKYYPSLSGSETDVSTSTENLTQVAVTKKKKLIIFISSRYNYRTRDRILTMIISSLFVMQILILLGKSLFVIFLALYNDYNYRKRTKCT